MRLHLLLLLSVVYLAPAFCQGGGFRVGRSAEPTALEVLEKQTDAITPAFRNKDSALLAKLLYNETVESIKKTLSVTLQALSFRAGSADYINGEVNGVVTALAEDHVIDTVKVKLRKDSDSPTGWVFVRHDSDVTAGADGRNLADDVTTEPFDTKKMMIESVSQ